MYRTNCGTRNEDTAANCVQCGNPIRQYVLPPSAPPPQPYVPAYAYSQPPQVPNYLVQAILVTVLCCLPFGIASIVYAAQVNGKLALGDMQGALHASRQAKLFAWISFGIGAGIVVIYGLIAVFGIASGHVR